MFKTLAAGLPRPINRERESRRQLCFEREEIKRERKEQLDKMPHFQSCQCLHNQIWHVPEIWLTIKHHNKLSCVASADRQLKKEKKEEEKKKKKKTIPQYRNVLHLFPQTNRLTSVDTSRWRPYTRWRPWHMYTNFRGYLKLPLLEEFIPP